MGKYRLKAWDDRDWSRKLTKTLSVARVDEDIPADKLKKNRKPWYLALTQNPDLLEEVGDVSGIPEVGTTILLSEYEVVELVKYLLESQTAVWTETDDPDNIGVGDYSAFMFEQPGMVEITEEGRVVNGEAQWSPSYFERQEPSADAPRKKFHTLPWKFSAKVGQG